MNWNGVQVFGNSYHPYAQDVMSGHSRTFNADMMLSIMDLQVFEPENLRGVKWVAWMPCDHHTLPQILLNQSKKAAYVLSMSKHLSAMLDAAGVENEHVPCMVDTGTFTEQQDARAQMGFPDDKFIIGMVAMNKGAPSRKAFHQNIAAFAALKAKHGDVMMYLHTSDGTRGLEVENLVEYCKALGLSYGYHMAGDMDKDVIFANQYGLSMGYEPELMAKIYSCMDVLTSVTRGEGFGIPIIEAQACGTPVIVGDWSSMPEICFSGWKVEKKEADPLFTPLMAWQYSPRPEAIAERMEKAFQMKGNPDYRKRAKAGAAQYDADRVFEGKWIPALSRAHEKTQAEKPDANMGILR